MTSEKLLLAARLSVLLAAALAVPACAGESLTAPAADEARLNELTAEYTQSYQAGAYAEAISVAKQALALAEQAFGSEHGQVAQVLNDLGRLYQSQHDLEQAGRMHEQALRIREKFFNAEGPAVVQSLTNLAAVYAAQGRYAEAQPLYERSLSIAERNVPQDSPSLLSVLEPYAAALRNGGKLEAAAVIEARIQKIRMTRGIPGTQY